MRLVAAGADPRVCCEVSVACHAIAQNGAPAAVVAARHGRSQLLTAMIARYPDVQLQVCAVRLQAVRPARLARCRYITPRTMGTRTLCDCCSRRAPTFARAITCGVRAL